MIRTIWALIVAEAIKLRRSAPMWLAIAAPVLLFGLELLTLFGRRTINPAAPARMWRDFLSFGWILWLGLFTPALVGMQAIGLAAMEHNGRHWKQLFALPAPRWSVFSVKILFCGVLIAVSFAAFLPLSVLAVVLFSASRQLGLSHSIPWGDLTVTLFRAFLASWLMIVIQTWLSVRFRGFAVPAGIAFAAVLAGVLLMGVSREAFGWWYPWTLPLNVRPDELFGASQSASPALFGIVASLALTPVVCWDLGRRTTD